VIFLNVQQFPECVGFSRIGIHLNSPNESIAEFESYAYPDRKSDHNEPETPIKENDHALDALRYALYMNSQQGSSFIPPPTVGLVKPYFPGIG
jgi:hypothetical protein